MKHPQPEAQDISGIAAQLSLMWKAVADGDKQRYYDLAEADMKRCAAPRCGGWLSALSGVQEGGGPARDVA